MPDILAKICETKIAEIAAQKKHVPLAALEAKLKEAPPVRGFKASIENSISRTNMAVIAEIKRASPSAGVLRKDFNAESLARDYSDAGAACLSVLTDAAYFQGGAEDLMAARAACTLPVLRKDFILDPYQVIEARCMGADCILLIMAALEDAQAEKLCQLAQKLGMDVLLEVHTKAEMQRALLLPEECLLGINNRNLKTLITDLNISNELAGLAPKSRRIISESGIKTPEDIQLLQRWGIQTYLIGESLLKQENVGEALRNLTRGRTV